MRKLFRKTFIFDYDDTLAPNQHDYDFAKVEFYKWLVQKIGYRCPDLQSLINFQTEIDTKNVEKMGFQMERFPTSIMETYIAVAERFNLPVTDEHKQEAYALGMLAFSPERIKQNGLLQGAEETLDFLVSMGDDLILMTKGDFRVQEMKIETNNLQRWFNATHIVPKKTPVTLLQVIGKRDLDFVWHVGNSIRSDVEPALQAGLKVIYIPCETWAYERNHKGKPTNKKVIEFGKLIEIKTRYYEII